MSERVIITKKNLQGYPNGPFLICAKYDERRMTEVHVEREDAAASNLLGNIYIGRVANILKNIQAAFIEVMPGFSCFCSLEDMRRPLFTKKIGKQPLCIGDELLVEVTREGRGQKTPTVSTNLSFPGKYLVLTTEVLTLGISKKIPKGDSARLRALLEPHLGGEYGLIARTNAWEASDADIERELQDLKDAYGNLREVASHRTAFSLLRQSDPFYLAYVKGLFWKDVAKVTTDLPDVYEALCQRLGLSDGELGKLTYYEDKLVSLPALYNLERELSRALEKKVWLPSGGYLYIEPTEALTVIDVNSGKDLRKKSQEDIFLSTNLEAAKEIARQLALRNISGICVVDFIDMSAKQHRDELMRIFREELKKDKIPTTLVDITRLGLVELTRKKVHKSLREQLQGG